MSFDKINKSGTSSTAVLIYGFVRDYDQTINSFRNAILEPNNADLFFFGPDYTDFPDKNFGIGTRDASGFFLDNPKSRASTYSPINKDKFIKECGKYLVNADFHNTPYSSFVEQSRHLLKESEWLFRLDPARILSMVYNMGGVIDRFLDHCVKTKKTYDCVVITRPDLIFYNKFGAKISEDEIHIPLGEGFDDIGRKPLGNAPVYYYKNMETGEYIPGGREIGFNDQFLALSFKSVSKLQGLYENVKECLKRKVPASPETILYLLCMNAGLKVISHPDWEYEIYRRGKKKITNVLESLELSDIDRNHPILLGGEGRDILEAHFTIADQFKHDFPSLSSVFPASRDPLTTENIPPPREIGIEYEEISPSLRLYLSALSFFMNDRVSKKMKSNTRQFFKDAKHPMTKFARYFYLIQSAKDKL